MNSRDRFLLALKGEKVDCPPLAHISALTTIELQDITGCYMPEVHTDAEKLVKLCAANYEVLGFDAVCFIINYFNEPAALGCKINWGNKSYVSSIVMSQLYFSSNINYESTILLKIILGNI